MIIPSRDRYNTFTSKTLAIFYKIQMSNYRHQMAEIHLQICGNNTVKVDKINLVSSLSKVKCSKNIPNKSNNFFHFLKQKKSVLKTQMKGNEFKIGKHQTKHRSKWALLAPP